MNVCIFSLLNAYHKGHLFRNSAGFLITNDLMNE